MCDCETTIAIKRFVSIVTKFCTSSFWRKISVLINGQNHSNRFKMLVLNILRTIVFNGFFILKINYTKQKLVKTCKILIILVNFVHLLIVTDWQPIKEWLCAAFLIDKVGSNQQNYFSILQTYWTNKLLTRCILINDPNRLKSIIYPRKVIIISPST